MYFLTPLVLSWGACSKDTDPTPNPMDAEGDADADTDSDTDADTDTDTDTGPIDTGAPPLEVQYPCHATLATTDLDGLPVAYVLGGFRGLEDVPPYRDLFEDIRYAGGFQTQQWEYDADGLAYYSYGDQWLARIETFYTGGLLTSQETDVDGDGNLETRTTLTYVGSLVQNQRSETFGANAMVVELDYQYDDDDRLVSIEQDEHVDGTLEAVTTYEYPDAQTVIASYDAPPGGDLEQATKTVTTTNPDGTTRVETSVYESNELVYTQTEVSTWNVDGTLASAVVTLDLNDGTTPSVSVYEWTYDADGHILTAESTTPAQWSLQTFTYEALGRLATHRTEWINVGQPLTGLVDTWTYGGTCP